LIVELAKGEAFRINDRYDVIIGREMGGQVRDTHLRGAINQVRAAGKTHTDCKGKKDLHRLLITPA
jgi:hypothetical protein